MKKIISTFIGFILFSPAFAGINFEVLSRLPANLSCEADFKGTGKIKFEVTQLNTSSPDVNNIPNIMSGLQNFDVSNLSTMFVVSNECDNYYQMIFFTEDLLNLKRGISNNTLGVARYFNSDTGTDEKTDNPLILNASISCKINNGESTSVIKSQTWKESTCSTLRSK